MTRMRLSVRLALSWQRARRGKDSAVGFLGPFLAARFFRLVQREQMFAALFHFSQSHTSPAVQSASRPTANGLPLYEYGKLGVQHEEGFPLLGLNEENIRLGLLDRQDAVCSAVHRAQQKIAGLKLAGPHNGPVQVFSLAALGCWIATKIADITHALQRVARIRGCQGTEVLETSWPS